MAISLNKPNMLGVNRSSGSSQSTSVSTTAAKNLTSGSRPTAFSFRNVSKRGWTPGQNTVKNFSKYDFSEARARLNPPPRHVQPAFTSGISYPAGNVTYQTSNAFNNGAKWGTGLAVGIGLLNGLVGILGKNNSAPVSTRQQFNNLAEGQGAGSGISTSSNLISDAAASAVSRMTAASDSSTLRQAIGGAETQLAKLSYVNNPETQTEYNTAKTDYESAKGEVKTCEKAKTDAEQEVSTTKQSVQTLTTTRDAKKSALTNAMTKKNQCNSTYATAHANTVAAQAAFDKTPDKIMGPDGNMIENPAKEAAQKALDQAKAAEDEAKKSLDEATQNEIAADEAVKSAEEDLKTEQKKLTEKENTLKEKENKLQKAKDDLAAAEKKRDDAKAKMDQIDSDKKDYATLQSEISRQKERLTKLEQDEQTKFNELSSQIDKETGEVSDRASRIDTSDGMNISERMRQHKNEKANARISSMTAQKDKLADNIAITNLLQSNNFEVGNNGEELRTGQLPSGKTVYFIGTKEVNQTDFEAAKPTTA